MADPFLGRLVVGHVPQTDVVRRSMISPYSINSSSFPFSCYSKLLLPLGPRVGIVISAFPESSRRRVSFYVVTRRRFRHYWKRMMITLLCTPPDPGLPISDPGWCMRRTEPYHLNLSPIVSETMHPGPWT